MEISTMVFWTQQKHPNPSVYYKGTLVMTVASVSHDEEACLKIKRTKENPTKKPPFIKGKGGF